MEKLKLEFKKNDNLLERALEEASLEEKDVFYNIKEEKTGILKNKKYVVEIVKKEDVGELGKEILSDLLKGLGTEGKIEIKIRNENISFNIFSSNGSILIGKRGHILSSIQVYLRQALQNKLDMHVNVTVDAEGYKEKQQYFLIRDVKRIAKEVTLSKSEVKLDPMNSYERKLVHDALANFEYIESKSEGEEPNRRIVISYKEKDK